MDISITIFQVLWIDKTRWHSSSWSAHQKWRWSWVDLAR